MSTRKRDAQAAELPAAKKQATLQRELHEKQERLREVQDRERVVERSLAEVRSALLDFMRKHLSGTLDENEKRQQELADRLERGYQLELGDIRQRITTTSSQIEAIGSELKGLSRPYIERLLDVGPPSQVEKQGLYKIQMSGDEPLYNCCCPAHAQPPLPLTLVNSVFAEFWDNFSDASVTLDDWVCSFVIDLCFNVLGRMDKFVDEAACSRAFNYKMGKFLEHVVAPESVSCGLKTAWTDGTVKALYKWWVLLLELKLDKGSTLVQGLQSFGIYAGAVNDETKLLPCFFIEVLGPTIRIGGLILGEKVGWHPLTPFMNCLYTNHDRTGMVTLCRAMLALKKGIIALESYYKGPLSSNTITPKDIPYPLEGKQSIRVGNKLVFIVTLDNEERIFKYCRQYGEEVHRSWANAGLAPRLHACKPIAGGWLEVQMEFLADWSLAFSLLNDMDGPAKHQLKGVVSKALDLALAIQIDGCLVAHGDMRPPNIMVRRDNWEVRFIDFDWAGKVGVARYPPFMNKQLPWHPDVGVGKVLQQCHDKWCLEQEGFWNAMTNAFWQPSSSMPE